MSSAAANDGERKGGSGVYLELLVISMHGAPPGLKSPPGKRSGNTLSSFIWLKRPFFSVIFLFNKFVEQVCSVTNKLKLDMTSGPLLVFGVSFFLADVLQVFLLPPVWMYMKEAGMDRRRADRKHHMTAAVIASETAKHIKTPLPLSRLLLPRSLFPDGIITQFPSRKWNRSENGTFQRADGLP